VLAENQQARAFYARFGFQPDGAEMTHERSGEKEIPPARPGQRVSKELDGQRLSKELDG
jgi:RimJ/RimL family protein N-acetyltransferase